MRFLEHLGSAFIVGSIIVAGIERTARISLNNHVRKLLEDISKGVIAAIYGKQATEEVFNFVERIMLKQPLYRKELTVNISLSPLKTKNNSTLQSDDIVIVHIVTNFSIFNNSDDLEKYEMKIFIERPVEKELEKHVKLLNVSIGSSSPIPISEFSQLDKNIPDTINHIYYGKEIDIPGRQSRRFKLEYQLVKYARDQLTWRSAMRSDGMLIEINYPSALQARAEEIHSIPAENETPVSITGVLRMRIRHPMMPHNGFEIFWAPRSGELQNGGSVTQKLRGAKGAPKVAKG